ELSVSRWLEAHTDRSAGLLTLPRNAVLADISGNGDYHLVITDLKLEKDTKSRLKVYKGTTMIHDQAINNVPNSVISFYTDEISPRIPGNVIIRCPENNVGFCLSTLNNNII
ncbi:hypothetical protein GWI33_010470, partial [Rhynchophorus ferrugineus]